MLRFLVRHWSPWSLNARWSIWWLIQAVDGSRQAIWYLQDLMLVNMPTYIIFMYLSWLFSDVLETLYESIHVFHFPRRTWSSKWPKDLLRFFVGHLILHHCLGHILASSSLYWHSRFDSFGTPGCKLQYHAGFWILKMTCLSTENLDSILLTQTVQVFHTGKGKVNHIEGVVQSSQVTGWIVIQHSHP